jgi:hypothetical protein
MLCIADPAGCKAVILLTDRFLRIHTKAKAAYETFLALWEEADPRIPVLKNAKAECDRLSL